MSLHLQRPTLLPSSAPDSIFASPKRKRQTDDLFDVTLAPSPIRLRTSNLPLCPAEDEVDLSGDKSPRSAIAGHLQNLNLTGYAFQFGKAMDRPLSSSCTTSTQAVDSASSQDSFESIETLPRTPPAYVSIGPLCETNQKSATLPLEIPETPRLKPTTNLSPIPSPIPRSKSPPLRHLWWANTEITGHDPTDPADDGYGINGVGFLPTPAMASARAERRKRQVAEWKSREAKEARQKRSEARRRRDYEINNEADVSNEGALGGSQERRVRFLEV
ncbi:MAG: hypothetical protein Q9220_007031 [cf. Caloplaca sp. 1 TL-2023]